MSAAIIVLRPEPGASRTIAAGGAVGLEMIAMPAASVEPCSWQAPDPATYDALLVGSANAFRHGGAPLDSLRGLPVLAVGKATAEAARAAGFVVRQQGQGGLQGVLDALPPGSQRLLRLAGAVRVTLDPPPAVSIDTRTLYRVVTRPLDLSGLPEMPLVLLHSASAAAHFAAEVDRQHLPRRQFTLVALGPRIAAAAGKGWAAVHSAARPDDESLLALTRELCDKRGLSKD